MYRIGNAELEPGYHGSEEAEFLARTRMMFNLARSDMGLFPFISPEIAPSASLLTFTLSQRYKVPGSKADSLFNMREGKLRMGIPSVWVFPSFLKPRSLNLRVSLLNLKIK